MRFNASAKIMKLCGGLHLSVAGRVADLDPRCMRVRVPGRWAMGVETGEYGGVRLRDGHDAKVVLWYA
jgi:hypothetical protein